MHLPLTFGAFSLSQQSGKQVILILEANPNGTKPLDGMAEVQAIRDLLEFRQLTDQFDLQLRPRVTRNVFIEAIGRYKPAIVHFIGHGSENALCLENNRGQADSITHEDVVDVLRTYAHDIDCVIFNACNTYRHAQAIAEFIPAVIGTTGSVNTQTATVYATGFYQGFFDAQCFRTAHVLGKAVIDQGEKAIYQFHYTPREQLNRLKLLKDTWPDYLQLRKQLTGMLPQRHELRSLCQQCFPSGLMGGLPRTDDMLEILDWVAERTLSGHHPPLLRLLKLIRQEMEPEVGTFIEAWLDDACADKGITLSDLSPHVSPTPLQQQDTPIYVMVEISPVQPNSSHCNAQAWLYLGEQTESLLVRDSADAIDLSSQESITQFTDDLVDAMSESEYLYGHHEQVILEFILPLTMLSLDIDNWRDKENKALGHDYRVTVRSQERIRKRRLQRFWKPITNDNLLLRHCAQVVSLQQLENTEASQLALEARANATSVIFKFSPQDHGLIWQYISEGLPVLLWPRLSCGVAGDDYEIDELFAEKCLLNLPKAVQEARCWNEQQVGRHLTLLWDDKYRLPPTVNLQSPQ